MAPQTPLLFVDNLLDTVQGYPAGVLTASSEGVGHEAYRVADYRRERSWWQSTSAAANHAVRIDLGAGASRAVDYLFLDRGHNLWGKTITLGSSATGIAPFTTQRTFTVPAVGTLGGDPTSTTLCVTEEGACYAIFTALGAARGWQVAVVESTLPVVPGLMLGLRDQFINFSTTFDEDAGERTQISATSKAGYRGTDTTYSWRVVEIGLALIGATEYDATVRTLRKRLFERNQPWVVLVMDYGTRPERAWMFQLDGSAWGMSKKRVYREGRLRLREVGQSLS
jgi:hypothetical protein